MKCRNCGSEIGQGETFCRHCGTQVPFTGNPNMNAGGQPYQQANNMSDMDYTPISMWGYFGYQLLFAIPCVGLIMLLVFSFGGTKNINLRNFARSYFCMLIIVVGLVIVMGIIFGVSAVPYLAMYS